MGGKHQSKAGRVMCKSLGGQGAGGAGPTRQIAYQSWGVERLGICS